MYNLNISVFVFFYQYNYHKFFTTSLYVNVFVHNYKNIYIIIIIFIIYK